MKKTLKALLFLALAVTLLTVAALADVIWEPYGNSFYDDNMDKCEYVGRAYQTNGEAGYVVVCADPRTGIPSEAIINGERQYVYYTCESDGVLWGCIIYQPEGGAENADGWVKMSEMLLLYDHEWFSAEHESEFEQLDTPRALKVGEYKKLIFWNCPGSPEFTAYDCSYHSEGDGWDEITFDSVWTDADGREWGRCDYYLGLRGWICLSDPESETLPATEIAYEGVITPVEPPALEELKNAALAGASKVDFTIIIVAVIVIAALATAAAIRKKLMSKKDE